MRPKLPQELQSPYRSKLEASYANHLEALRLAGDIIKWEYEPETFVLAYDLRYIPDWKVYPAGVLSDALHEWHATTGYLRRDSNVKLKMFAELVWPHLVYSVRRIKGQWVKKLVKTRQGTNWKPRKRNL